MSGGKIMTKLNCSVTSCAYNDEKLCCLDNIKVEGTTADISDSTACASFEERRNSGYSNSYGSREPRYRLSIECMAEKCVYNRAFRCSADHIDVAGDGAKDFDETRCATFTLD